MKFYRSESNSRWGLRILVTLYCSCVEREVKFWYDPARKIPLDDTLMGQIKRAWRIWRER